MTLHDVLGGLQIAFMVYFFGYGACYLVLNLLAFIQITRSQYRREYDALTETYSELKPPVSILVPAYQEEGSIVTTVRSLLQLTYPTFEIIVINDGSRDRTLANLQEAFALTPFPEAYRVQLETQPIKGFYRSTQYPNLRVIDKENGGKSDSLNAGLNAARHALFCAIDADSILQRDSLQEIVKPFLEDPDTVASGGSIRVANGCVVKGGYLLHVGLPKNPLALFQIPEYLRAFLFGRMGWDPLNALLIISGAFGMFRTETVIEVGGYARHTIGEDMELIVRMHRTLRLAGKPYRIAFAPYPVCWTEVPEDLRSLINQRSRWQRGLCESLLKNRDLFLHPRGGLVGWVAFPFMVVFECLGPAIEVAAYLTIAASLALGAMSGEALSWFLFLAVGFGMLVSASCLFLEEIVFHSYPRLRQVLAIFGLALLENLGYRQLNAFMRLKGLLNWLGGRQAQWGTIKRSASWSS